MEKRMALLLATGILVAAGCEAQQKQAVPMRQAAPVERAMSQAVEEAAPQAARAVSQAIEQVAPEANAMVEKAQALIAQAKELLDAGKFDEAIAVAQNVLSFDPANLDAQNIIAMAQEKLKALVATQAGEVKSGIMDQIGSVVK
jgi:hypothetical protein